MHQPLGRLGASGGECMVSVSCAIVGAAGGVGDKDDRFAGVKENEGKQKRSSGP